MAKRQQPAFDFAAARNGYIPKTGDRVLIVAPEDGSRPVYISGLFDGRKGTVRGVAPALSNAHVHLDGEDDRYEIRFFPGELLPLLPENDR